MKKNTLQNNTFLMNAASEGDVQQVEALIPVSDPKTEYSRALRRAAFYGHIECVQLLIPVSDPKADDSVALRMAARDGRIHIVRLLIPVSDPKALDSWALQAAALNEHNGIVDLLWDVSDVKAALTVLHDEHADDKHVWQYIQQKWDAHVQLKTLTQTVRRTKAVNTAHKKVHKI